MPFHMNSTSDAGGRGALVLTLVSDALRHFFSNEGAVLHLPLQSTDLLRHLVLTVSPSSSADSHLRLTDQRALDTALTTLANSGWEHGSITIAKYPGPRPKLEVVAISVNPIEVRKRKRAESSASPPLSSSIPVERSPLAPLTLNDTLSALLKRGTARQKLLAEQFSSGKSTFEPICEHTTKADCVKYRASQRHLPPLPARQHCEKIHFRPIIRPHTDPSLGHCSYLNTCYSEPTFNLNPANTNLLNNLSTPTSTPSNPNAFPRAANSGSLPSGLGAGGRGKDKQPCRYLHFEIDYVEGLDSEGPPPPRFASTNDMSSIMAIGSGPAKKLIERTPPQWINCDLRTLDPAVLGKFHVIMADPPWDIHMNLPYGTMSDDEMLSMPIPALQDEGILMLWVTGRAMEVGRECMKVWGYTRIDEVVWVKTNQLQRVIRTGRTGHWLNHTKEHLLIGLKNQPGSSELVWPSWLNRGLDTDVIVAEVRETSRKPDEVYEIAERMCVGGRKLEIFGRKHNTRPGWLTLGNQLGSDQIYEPDLAQRLNNRYPERNVSLMSSHLTDPKNEQGVIEDGDVVMG